MPLFLTEDDFASKSSQPDRIIPEVLTEDELEQRVAAHRAVREQSNVQPTTGEKLVAGVHAATNIGGRAYNVLAQQTPVNAWAAASEVSGRGLRAMGVISDEDLSRTRKKMAELRATAKEMGKQWGYSESTQKAIREGRMTLGRLAEQGSDATIQLLPMVGASIVATPAAGLAVAGAQAGLQEYDAALDRLKDRTDLDDDAKQALALAGGVVRGGIAAVTERVPLGAITSKFPGFQKHLTNAALQRAITVGKATFGEGAQEVVEDSVMKAWQRTIEQDPDAFKDYARDMRDSFLLGTVAGGAMKAGVSTTSFAAQAFEESNKNQLLDQTVAIMQQDGGFEKLRALSAKEKPSRKDYLDAGFTLRRRPPTANQRKEFADVVGQMVDHLLPRGSEVVMAPQAEVAGVELGDSSMPSNVIDTESVDASGPVQPIQDVPRINRQNIDQSQMPADFAAAPEVAMADPTGVTQEAVGAIQGMAESYDAVDEALVGGKELHGRATRSFATIQTPMESTEKTINRKRLEEHRRIAGRQRAGLPTTGDIAVNQTIEQGRAKPATEDSAAPTDKRTFARFGDTKKRTTEVAARPASESTAASASVNTAMDAPPPIAVSQTTSQMTPMAGIRGTSESTVLNPEQVATSTKNPPPTMIPSELRTEGLAETPMETGANLVANAEADELLRAELETIPQPKPSLTQQRKSFVLDEDGFATPDKVLGFLETDRKARQAPSLDDSREVVNARAGTVGRVKGWFRSAGRKPQWMYNAHTRSQGQSDVETKNAEFLMNDVHLAARKAYGIGALDDLPQGVSEQIASAITGEGSIDALPEEMRAPARKMRAQVDHMSRQVVTMLKDAMGVSQDTTKAHEIGELMIRWANQDFRADLASKAKGKRSGDFKDRVAPDGYQPTISDRRQKILDALDRRWNLIETIEGSYGKYLTRVYQAFDDPAWADKVSPEVVEDAVNRIMRDNKDMPERVARQLAGTILHEASQTHNPVGFFMTDLQTPNTSVLKKRTLEAPEIQDLLGMRKDLSQFQQTVAKLGQMVTQYNFLADMRDAYEGTHFWKGTSGPAAATAYVTMKSKNAMNPLAGYKTTPEIAAALQDVEAVMTDPGVVLKTWHALEKTAAMSATVYSAKTQIRNFIANPAILIGNGWGNFLTPKGLLDSAKQFGKASEIAAAVSRAKDNLSISENAEVRERALAAIKHKVVDNEVLTGILDAVGKQARSGIISVATKEKIHSDVKKVVGEKLYNAAMKALKTPKAFYMGSDNVFKIAQFESETDLMKRAFPDISLEDARALAAEVVRNEQPNYSKIPAIATGGAVGKHLPIGLFIAFRAERIRNFVHWNETTLKRLTSGNPVLMANAVKRIGLKTAMLTLFTKGIAAATRGVFGLWEGVSEEEEEAVRDLSAHWDADAALWISHGKKNERGHFVLRNVSYQDPDGFLPEAFNAFWRGYRHSGSAVKGMLAASASLADPWLGEKLMTQKIFDVSRNTTENGTPVYNKEDSVVHQMMSIAAHVAPPLIPATFRQIGDVKKGVDGYVSPGGKQYEWQTEAMSIFTGGRNVELNPANAIRHRSRDFVNSMRDAIYIYTGPAGTEGTKPSDDELRGYYKRAENARQRVFERMTRHARAGMTLQKAVGKSDDEARAYVSEAMRKGGVAVKDHNNIIDGIYKPYVPRTIEEVDQMMRVADPDHLPHLMTARKGMIATKAMQAGSKSDNPETTKRAAAAWQTLQTAKVSVPEVASALYADWVHDDQKAIDKKYEKRRTEAPKVRRPKITPSRRNALDKFGIRIGDFLKGQ